ncbi:uncharacterized protein NECHADRAFT_88840 [Fusarium vanettenii 77-13-4]|uniref:Uncharacterized protein n=1 Tax=Fusarium vanettenii (strain ATCC MYA-4622 / CBS 123669 / FGSC 9596 / NRRL 45880 / 77-13-4) TaxID=660122 RepID=C7ZN60_FUSV7|nr:uncharacterized protein NECHADRAFT_88840 [Fusarium vanettenii 77-13-4]EEU34547.1 predicted protein [Fusarium vanettenii 77-13-4]
MLVTGLVVVGFFSRGFYAVTDFYAVTGISMAPIHSLVYWFSGSQSDPQSQDFHVRPNSRPLIFDPPRHGGVLESLSSQSYILRQAHASTLTLPANLSADLDRIAAEIHLSQSRFAKMMKGYEQCNFRNDDLHFMYQVFDHNETLADYEDKRDTGSEVTWSWVSWISFSSAKASAKRWHPREILEIASSMTESIPSQQQKLNATIICLGSALEDMEDISTLLGDPVHDLDAIKNIAPRGIASRVSGIRSNLVMTIKIIAAARNGLQEESGMVKDKIQELDGHFTLLKNKSANLERVMKAGEVDDSSRRELKNEMERMCQHVLERRKKD